jgi:heavy metal sensor kinase
MAQRSLGPLQSMTARARAIGATTLDQRIPLRGNGDELDRLAETLNEMLERIERHVKRLRQFTADASHELRSPVAVLRCNAELAISRSRSAAELREVIEDSIEHLNRLSRVAEDLLLLAKADADELPLSREAVDLADAVGDIVDLYGPLAQERNIQLCADAPEPVIVAGDPVYLRQLIANVVDNAVKYLGSGARVSVSLSCHNGVATMVVTDDGPGIAPEHLPHVFDRFYRVDQARSPSGQRGAGLGLPICRMIAEAHQGSILIARGTDGGAVVTIQLPRHPDHAGTAPSGGR